MTILHAACIVYLVATLFVIWDLLTSRNDKGEPTTKGYHTFVFMWLPVPLTIYALTV